MKRAFRFLFVSVCAMVVPVAGLLTLGGCGSPTSIPDLRASTPTIYLQSTLAPDHVSRCLERRLPDVQTITDGDDAELLVERRAWLIDISAANGATRIAAHRGNDGERIEPDVRFAIARCAL